MITIGKFGFLVLNLEINPQKVDVNVHPAKLEVRFEEESKVFKAVYHAIKDTLLKEGLSEGIKKVVSSAIDLGKSAMRDIYRKFWKYIANANSSTKRRNNRWNVRYYRLCTRKDTKSGILPTAIARTIRTGKNTLLNNVANNIENEFNGQIRSVERLQRYSNNWKECFNNKDFQGMTTQIYKIRAELKELVPMENTLKEARTIENLHNLIKNNGKDFNLSSEQQELAKMLI